MSIKPWADPPAVSSALEGEGEGEVRPAKTSIAKTVTSDDMDRILAGDELTYTVTTTSDEALRTAYKIVTTDVLPEGVDFVSATGGGTYADGTITWPAADLDAGETRSFEVVVSVDEGFDGELSNTATNVGENTCFVGDTTGSVCSAVAVASVVTPGITLDKRVIEVKDTSGAGVASVETGGVAGDTVVYGFEVKNTGTATESTLTLNDPMLGIVDEEFLSAPLAPGAIATFPETFEYVLTEADVETGSVVNTASVKASDVPESTDSVTTDALLPGFEFTKLADAVDTNTNGVLGDAGDTIEYGFSVENTGETVLNTALLTDELLGLEDVELLTEPLAVGDTVVRAGEFEHVITAEDVTAGEVVNLATLETPGASGTDSSVETPTKPAPEPVKVPVKDEPKGAVTGDPMAADSTGVFLGIGGGLLAALAAGSALWLRKRRSQA